MYACKECQTQYKKWYGQCTKCKEWNTIEEVIKMDNVAQAEKPVLNLSDISEKDVSYLSSGIKQLDLVMGGGFVPGSLTLLGGQPGIGKSTLILTLANNVANNKDVLYVSGEENLGQIKIRANRLKIKNDIKFLNEQNIQSIKQTAIANKIEFLIIDSVQTTVSQEISSASGSVAQLKAVALEMMDFAKVYNITVILIGHVTKEGDIAGPKLLEHMVDTVLYLEAESNSNVRLLRCEKNRFGSTTEVGMFQMTAGGLETFDQNELLKINSSQYAEGISMGGFQVGARSVLLEVQSLVTKSVYPSPKRNGQGIEISRLNILIAILQKHMQLELNYDDVYVKVRGSYKAIDTSVDLAIITSLWSSKSGVRISGSDLYLGEVTLTGEILPLNYEAQLIDVAQKLGYKRIFCNNDHPEVIKVKNIQELFKYLGG